MNKIVLKYNLIIKEDGILHLSSNLSIQEQEERFKLLDVRLSILADIFNSEEISSGYIYKNWFELEEPYFITWKNYLKDSYKELSKAIKSKIQNAEESLLVDKLFEDYIYTKKGLFPNEWSNLPQIEKEILFLYFNPITKLENFYEKYSR